MNKLIKLADGPFFLLIIAMVQAVIKVQCIYSGLYLWTCLVNMLLIKCPRELEWTAHTSKTHNPKFQSFVQVPPSDLAPALANKPNVLLCSIDNLASKEVSRGHFVF